MPLSMKALFFFRQSLRHQPGRRKSDGKAEPGPRSRAVHGPKASLTWFLLGALFCLPIRAERPSEAVFATPSEAVACLGAFAQQLSTEADPERNQWVTAEIDHWLDKSRSLNSMFDSSKIVASLQHLLKIKGKNVNIHFNNHFSAFYLDNTIVSYETIKIKHLKEITNALSKLGMSEDFDLANYQMLWGDQVTEFQEYLIDISRLSVPEIIDLYSDWPGLLANTKRPTKMHEEVAYKLLTSLANYSNIAIIRAHGTSNLEVASISKLLRIFVQIARYNRPFFQNQEMQAASLVQNSIEFINNLENTKINSSKSAYTDWIELFDSLTYIIDKIDYEFHTPNQWFSAFGSRWIMQASQFMSSRNETGSAPEEDLLLTHAVRAWNHWCISAKRLKQEDPPDFSTFSEAWFKRADHLHTLRGGERFSSMENMTIQIASWKSLFTFLGNVPFQLRVAFSTFTNHWFAQATQVSAETDHAESNLASVQDDAYTYVRALSSWINLWESVHDYPSHQNASIDKFLQVVMHRVERRLRTETEKSQQENDWQILTRSIVAFNSFVNLTGGFNHEIEGSFQSYTNAWFAKAKSLLAHGHPNPNLTAQYITACAWSWTLFAHLGSTQGIEPSILFPPIHRLIMTPPQRGVHLPPTRAHQAYTYLSYDKFIAHTLAESQVDKCRERLLPQLERSLGTSNIQRYVSNAINAYISEFHFGTLQVENEIFSERTGTAIDIAITPIAGGIPGKILIQVDGPSHYLKTTHAQRPQDRLIGAILVAQHGDHRQGPVELIRIPYLEIDTKLNHKNNHINELVSNAIAKTFPFLTRPSVSSLDGRITIRQQTNWILNHIKYGLADWKLTQALSKPQGEPIFTLLKAIISSSIPDREPTSNEVTQALDTYIDKMNNSNSIINPATLDMLVWYGLKLSQLPKPYIVNEKFLFFCMHSVEEIANPATERDLSVLPLAIGQLAKILKVDSTGFELKCFQRACQALRFKIDGQITMNGGRLIHLLETWTEVWAELGGLPKTHQVLGEVFLSLWFIEFQKYINHDSRNWKTDYTIYISMQKIGTYVTAMGTSKVLGGLDFKAYFAQWFHRTSAYWNQNHAPDPHAREHMVGCISALATLWENLNAIPEAQAPAFAAFCGEWLVETRKDWARRGHGRLFHVQDAPELASAWSRLWELKQQGAGGGGAERGTGGAQALAKGEAGILALIEKCRTPLPVAPVQPGATPTPAWRIPGERQDQSFTVLDERAQ